MLSSPWEVRVEQHPVVNQQRALIRMRLRMRESGVVPPVDDPSPQRKTDSRSISSE